MLKHLYITAGLINMTSAKFNQTEQQTTHTHTFFTYWFWIPKMFDSMYVYMHVKLWTVRDHCTLYRVIVNYVHVFGFLCIYLHIATYVTSVCTDLQVFELTECLIFTVDHRSQNLQNVRFFYINLRGNNLFQEKFIIKGNTRCTNVTQNIHIHTKQANMHTV